MADASHTTESQYGGVFTSLIEGSEEENRHLAEELFAGELLEWAALRLRNFGDYIMPKIVYVEPIDDQQHKVAWVEHSGLNATTEERFHNHHIVCECVLCKNFNDGRGGIDTSACQVMSHALEARARIVGAEFQPAFAASQNYEAVNVITGSPETARQFDVEGLSLSAIEHVLRSDNAHPEAWHGNLVSGSLPVEQAGKIVGQPLELVIHCAELLRRSGRVNFDGDTLRLAA